MSPQVAQVWPISLGMKSEATPRVISDGALFGDNNLSGVLSGGSVTPDFTEDFSTYADTAALAASAKFSATYEHVTANGASVASYALNKTDGYNGRTQCMEYSVNHGSGDGLTSPEIRRGIGFTARQDVWARFYVKFSSNFTTHNSSGFPNDMKFIFGETEDDLTYRWGFHLGMDGDPTTGTQHTIGWDYPLGSGFPSEGLRYNGILANDLWDGAWHEYKFYIKNSTTTSSNDGVLKNWIDGVLRWNKAGFSTKKSNNTPEKINGFSFTHNMDDGPVNVLMTIRWGLIELYYSDPGW